ncbi:DUF4362 domain-containing protein [Paenibacillus sp. 22594]|uniref:DUF4362 domain-containing protein n=1 Tax=Paenibacillus sp. 22594 TaxID=3453947 RepID=UPI003F87B114
MKRTIFAAAAVLLAFSIGGCGSKTAYTSQEAIEKGDVVLMNKAYNFTRFQKFLNNLDSRRADSIRITAYTDEGDPIFKDLQYDGDKISYRVDNSNDAYGGKDKGIRRDTCSEIVREEGSGGEIFYTLSGCNENDPEISYFLVRTDK